MGVAVRVASAADVAAIAAVLARAFARDPVTNWVSPNERHRALSLPRLYASIARYDAVPLGATWLAQDADDRTLGAAVWRPPDARAVSWRSIPFSLSAGAALGRDMARMTAMGRAVARARPRAPHWYLQLLGVDPALQRGGVGSALVRAQLARIDADGMAAYLETTVENLDFYARFGFRAVGEITIHRGAPREYSLWRDPA